MKASTRLLGLAAVSVCVPSAGAAQAPVAASCRAAEAMLRELAVPALETGARADSLWNQFQVAEGNYRQAEGEAETLGRRMDDSADSLASVLLSPAVADSLRSDRIWLGLSGSFTSASDSQARRDSVARADSLMDDRVRLHVGLAVADSMAAARDSYYVALDRDFEASRRGDEVGNEKAFLSSRWWELLRRSGALRDSLRVRAEAGAHSRAMEADSVLARRLLLPLVEAWGLARERRDSLLNLLYGAYGDGEALYERWAQADSAARLAGFDLEWDAPELGGYAARVSIAVEFRGAAARCRSCPALTTVGDAWRLVMDQIPDRESGLWPDDPGSWTDPDSWRRRMAGRSWEVFISAVMEAAECVR
ncbi:hypothetical protein [Candidatus Palauibacter sp.]|uniref:hypothetical protein n=1 Tax=Candidatus Palauibacter sp. TaxID=3101350 RepID=UPI003C6F0021